MLRATLTIIAIILTTSYLLTSVVASANAADDTLMNKLNDMGVVHKIDGDALDQPASASTDGYDDNASSSPDENAVSDDNADTGGSNDDTMSTTDDATE